MQNDLFGHVRDFFFRHPRVADRHLLASPQTMFGSTLVYDQENDDGDTVRYLSINGLKESATYTDDRWNELVFDYTDRYNLMFTAGIPIERVLMIGGGGYSYPKYLISHRPDVAMDVVELDPAITQLAREFFFLDRLEERFAAESSGRLRVLCEDGRDYLERVAGGAADASRTPGAAAAASCGGARPAGETGLDANPGAADAGAGGLRYDAVLNDSFAAGLPAPTLTTVEAARAVKACLVPGGLYLSNVVSALEGPHARFLQAEAATLRRVFARVHVVPVTDYGIGFLHDNLMVIATDGAYRFPGEKDVRIPADAPVLTDADNPVEDLIDWQ